MEATANSTLQGQGIKKFEWDSSYLNANEKSTSSNRELHSLLFYPKSDEITAYIADAIKNKDEAFRHFGTFSGKIWSALNHFVQTQFNKCSGQIHLEYLYQAIEKVAKVWDMVEFFHHLGTTNKSHYENNGLKFINCTSESQTLIAIGVLNEDYVDGDNDCYQTAGGYRSYKALAGTIVEYHLNKDLSITLKFDSNCVTDHYNNNFCGVSTGNGTKNYKVGERVEKRNVTLGREAIDKSWKKASVNASVKKIDYNKITNLIEQYQPELFSAINK